MKPFISKEARDFVDASVETLNEEEPVSFSGSLRSARWQDGVFEGAFNLLVPGVRFKGLEMKRLSAGVSFGGGILRASGIEAVLDDGTKLSGEMLCVPAKGSFSASMFCIGSPERALSLLGPEHRSFLESVLKDIEWPLAGNLVESSIDIHATGGAKPSCFMTGSLVMTDFEYRGVKFKYGATRFMSDSDRLLVLPGAILESADGQALISIAYHGAGSAGGPASGASPEGRLEFSIESALSGNDLLRCLYPQWKSEFVGFPKSLGVSAKGSIDYRNPDASRFSAVIDNGSCVWKGVPVGNLDANVRYGGRRLSLKGASAEMCEGKLDIDYGFDFKSMSGDVAVKMQNADLQPLLKRLGWGGLVGDGKAGRLSGDIKSKLSYGKDGQLLMDGKGRINVAGADLWSIPLFGDFLTFLGKAWSLKSLGSITTVDCDFNLVGNKLTTESFKSDGGVVALSANGDYLWNTNEFDFKFRAALLKGALPFETMSALLSPVSWMLERRLHGKDKTFCWE